MMDGKLKASRWVHQWGEDSLLALTWAATTELEWADPLVDEKADEMAVW